jgi:hypothetical protein
MGCRSVRPTTLAVAGAGREPGRAVGPVIVFGSVSKEGSAGTAISSGTDAIVQL